MRELFAAARVAALATLDGDGRPQLVPICFALDGDRIVSVVDSKPKRTTELARLRNVRADPRVSVLAHHYEDDWSALWWVRIRGSGRVIEDGPEHDDAVALLEGKYPQYCAEPPTGPVLEISIEEISSWKP
jgi:PPOX class probable F420-dependent enzyme